MITTIQSTSDSRVNFYWQENKKYLGTAYKEVDGYYVFEDSTEGIWAAHQLRAIADKLDELNKEWNEQVNRDIQQDIKEL